MWKWLINLVRGFTPRPAHIPSYDLVGSREGAVAIVDIPSELRGREGWIAREIMRRHRNVRSVLRKASERVGPFRLRAHKLIAGDELTEVVHREYGYRLKLDPRLVYFSPREGTERQRVASQVRPREIIMYQFCGVAPYAMAILKAQPRVKKIIAVDINPDAIRYAVENIKLNRLEGKVIAILGDVREVCGGWYGKCDRVIMTLPLGATGYLDVAARCLKPQGGVIHYYSWGPEADPFSRARGEIRRVIKKFKILDERLVLPYRPRTFKVCVDVKVLKKVSGKLMSDIASVERTL
jgi:tRNA (guanine37-N1)-methyltransferase